MRLIASPAERRMVEKLRYQVYVEEMHKPYPDANHFEQRLGDSIDDESCLFGAFHGPSLVGTMRLTVITSEHQHASFPGLRLDLWQGLASRNRLAVCSRLVVDRAHRAGGRISLALIRASTHHGRARGIEVVLCSTIPSLVTFFSTLGFHQSGPAFSDSGSGRTQVPLALTARDVILLRAMGSPFMTAHASALQD